MSTKNPQKTKAPQSLFKPVKYPYPIKLSESEQEQVSRIRQATGLKKSAIMHAGLGYSFAKFLSGEVSIAQVIMEQEKATANGK